jgi:hypothetical protein
VGSDWARAGASFKRYLDWCGSRCCHRGFAWTAARAMGEGKSSGTAAVILCRLFGIPKLSSTLAKSGASF